MPAHAVARLGNEYGVVAWRVVRLLEGDPTVQGLGVSADGSRVYLAKSGTERRFGRGQNGVVSVVQLAGGDELFTLATTSERRCVSSLHYLPAHPEPDDIAIGRAGTALACPLWEAGTVVIIDTARRAVVAELDLSAGKHSSGPAHVVTTPASDAFYIACADGTLATIN